MSYIDYTNIFSKHNNPLRIREVLGEDTYRVYYVDTSGIMHGSEKIYRSDVGYYPGGYCWDDLELSRIYIKGQQIAEYTYCNNYKRKPDICEAKEYNSDTNTSNIVYYNFKYMHDTQQYGIASWNEYSFNGHYKDFVKDSYNGLVYLWEKTLESSQEDNKAILKEVHLYQDGKFSTVLKKYYKNGLLKQDEKICYNYSYSTYILKGQIEEYFSIDSSGQLCNKYYKYSDDILKECISYINGKKHGPAEYYILVNDANMMSYIIEYIEDKEVKRSDYIRYKIYTSDINNNVSVISEYMKDRMYPFSKKVKEYTISGCYLDISNMNPKNESLFIKHGSYMEWYTNASSLFLLLRYENGQLNGISRSFYENGTPNVTGKYINGKKIGIFSYSDLSGNIKYFNHDIGEVVHVIDIGEQLRGPSKFDTNAFLYSNFETGSLLD